MRDAPRLRACSLEAPAIVLEWPMRVRLLVLLLICRVSARVSYWSVRPSVRAVKMRSREYADRRMP